MTGKQARDILSSCSLPDSCENPHFIETHISWLLLSDHFAFKIKRPVSFSFLDFTTLEKRRHYCHRELELNRRFSPDMYIAVLPVDETMGITGRHDENGETIDYAVQMKRMDSGKRMDTLLEQDRVSDRMYTKLAKKIASFHDKAGIVRDPFDTPGFQEKYSDLLTVGGYIREHLGDARYRRVRKCIARSNIYLARNRDYFNERIISGRRRDVHGDLKTSNIFLYDDPVLFDCLEFSDEDRQIDVLNDVAFLCVDIDLIQGRDKGDLFYGKYLDAAGSEPDQKSHNLFLYYKSYRANIRAKLNALKAKGNTGENGYHRKAEKLLELMEEYIEALD